jgi:hypothetical protein
VAAKVPLLRMEIVKRSDDMKGFVVLTRRRVVERSADLHEDLRTALPPRAAITGLNSGRLFENFCKILGDG